MKRGLGMPTESQLYVDAAFVVLEELKKQTQGLEVGQACYLFSKVTELEQAFGKAFAVRDEIQLEALSVELMDLAASLKLLKPNLKSASRKRRMSYVNQRLSP